MSAPFPAENGASSPAERRAGKEARDEHSNPHTKGEDGLFIQPCANGAWLPIESAPKDGTHILILTLEGAAFRGHWLTGDHDDGWWYDPINDHEYIHTPIAGWMPLPAPPDPSR